MLQDNLLNNALKIFVCYGIKQSTMDDIARACGISKKTLYSHFENKAEIVDAAIINVVEKIHLTYENNILNCKNAIEETLSLLHNFECACKQLNFRMLMDLERYYYKKPPERQG